MADDLTTVRIYDIDEGGESIATLRLPFSEVPELRRKCSECDWIVILPSSIRDFKTAEEAFTWLRA